MFSSYNQGKGRQQYKQHDKIFAKVKDSKPINVSDNKVTSENTSEPEKINKEIENDEQRVLIRTATLPELNERIRMYFKRQDRRGDGTMTVVEDLDEFDNIIYQLY